MKKNDSSEKKYPKKKNSDAGQKNLFDHLNSIRTTKQPDYYESLNEKEKKEFNHWAILNGLSMDTNLIELVSFLWRSGYYDKIPSPQFYKMLVEIVPQTNQKLFWVKKTKKINKKLLDYIANWYSISTRESSEYLNILMSTDDGMKELAWILEGLGLTDKEAEKLFEGDTE